ncbi:MAG: cadherin-like domain-containing protein [Planctomycetales bacterium]|nr:cadherin-like domain-containing protein [Planctomycetales bacterium]
MSTSRWLAVESLESRRLLAFNPTGFEQELLQLTNRFRTDPSGEFSRLISSASPITARDPVVQNDLTYFGVDGNVLRAELQALPPVPPVGWNDAASTFSQSHNAAMLAANPPNHFHSDLSKLRSDLLAAGVDLRLVVGEKVLAENVYGYAKSVNHLHASYIIDWGAGPGGMQVGRNHRVALNNSDFDQLGTSIRTYNGTAFFGPLVNTQQLLNINNTGTMVIGAIFQDLNASGWYEAGEGIGSVQFLFEGAAGRFTTAGMSAGGYQIQLPPGTYRATASGGGMRYPVVIPSLTVGSSNVWQNFIFDPNVIPPDVLEPNNSLATATQLTGAAQTQAGLSVHQSTDKDYFRLVSAGTGRGSFEIRFTHSEGNLDLRLLNSSGVGIATSSGQGNSELVTANLVRGQTYFLEVSSVGGARNGAYALLVTPPAPAAPVANTDRADANNASRSVTIDLIANDVDPDGNAVTLVPKLVAGTPTAFQLNGHQLTYTAPAGYAGVHQANYTVTDDQGLTSAPGKIEIFVVNFALPRPWLNVARPNDINGDGVVAPSDVLMLVNDLNSRAARLLPTHPSGSIGILGFYDSNGDGYVSPIDVLLVVNQLNAGAGEGEDVAGNESPLLTKDLSNRAIDLAFAQMQFIDFLSDVQRRKFDTASRLAPHRDSY